MATDFDAIVIGSGFGGAVTACRLAEHGYRVLVLERGRRWDVKDFPRKPDDAWIWDPNRPERHSGWFEFRVFPNMTVVQGAGVGGGSLVYANISVEAKRETFDSGWPPEISYDELKPHYDKVAQTMNVKPVPPNQWPERTRLLKEGAEKVGYGERFRPLDLAVSFDPEWSYEAPDPHDPAKSKRFINAQGREQGTCVHLGTCDIGCDVNARNTLDLNYLALAERHHAEIRPLHLARAISPEPGGYRVSYDELKTGQRIPGSQTARLIIVAAGSLGSTELLLRCRDQGTLPALSPFLGRNWSSNGDFLTPAIHPFRAVRPTKGPTITAAIDLLDGAYRGQDIFIEDGGFPDVAGGYLQRLAGEQAGNERQQALLETVRLLTSRAVFDNVMPWFAQGRDAANGVLSLKNGKLFLDWNIDESEKTIDAIVNMHQQLATKTGGLPLTPLTWILSKDLITPHPLGGCSMGVSSDRGVVDHAGEVFGHRNLFVADGAIVPKAMGLNPSRTIGALAERIAALIVAEGR